MLERVFPFYVTRPYYSRARWHLVIAAANWAYAAVIVAVVFRLVFWVF